MEQWAGPPRAPTGSWTEFFRFLGTPYGVLAVFVVILPLVASLVQWVPHVPGCKPIACGLAAIGCVYVLLVLYGLRRDFRRTTRVPEGVHSLREPIHVLALLFLALSLIAALGYMTHFEPGTPNAQLDTPWQWRFAADYDYARLIAAGLFNLVFIYLAAALGLKALMSCRQEIE